MRVLVVILMLAVGGIVWSMLPGSGLSDDSVIAVRGSASGGTGQPAVSAGADAAVEAAIKAYEQTQAGSREKNPAAVTGNTPPENIATGDVKSITAEIAAAAALADFKPDRMAEIIDLSEINDMQKATLKRLVSTAQGNPDLLRSALAQAGRVMQ